MNSHLIQWAKAAGRVSAFLAGGDPLVVWETYRTFEEDSSILFDTVEAFYDTVKPILEEREREYERSKPTSLIESSHVAVPSEARLHKGNTK